MRFFFIPLILLWALPCWAVDWSIRGQASGWNNTDFNAWEETQLGLRYIPELAARHSTGEASFVDVDVSLNMTGGYDVGERSGKTSVTAHRAWLRFAATQFELRSGLQQIKFGQAMILRPLMWFDRIDPRDPLQFTNGVTAALFRYYFLNNANIWLWGIYSNGEKKGLEIIPSVDHSFEYGGRIQHPVGSGELAFTYHHRKADPDPLVQNLLPSAPGPVPENRYALDGKWDIGIGAWFEGAVVHQDLDRGPNSFQKYLTVGADYTFGLGNGLHTLAEHMWRTATQEWNGTDATDGFSALLADYNLTLWDMVMGMVYYSWETKDFYRYFTWRRTYDNWSFNAGMYWNPENPIPGGQGDDNPSTVRAGKGFQIMVIFNH